MKIKKIFGNKNLTPKDIEWLWKINHHGAQATRKTHVEEVPIKLSKRVNQRVSGLFIQMEKEWDKLCCNHEFDYFNDGKSFIRQQMQKTIEKCQECVPKEEKPVFYPQRIGTNGCLHFRSDGFNLCRQWTLVAMEKLKKEVVKG